ncbi:MAG TPA: DMT family transporter, partial [Actinomycetota bacterium]|nr:DMT family transporter [Actinomycetota bacterium]
MRSAGRGGPLVLGAAVLWGTTGTARALAPPGASPEAVGAVRLLVGGIALLSLASATGALRRGGTWPRAALVVAAVGMAAYQPLFFSAVARTGVAVGTAVAIGCGPVLAGAVAWVALGERPGARWAVATALAVAGTTLLVLGGRRAPSDPIGVGLAAGAGLAYATYAVASKRLLRARPPLAVAG